MVDFDPRRRVGGREQVIGERGRERLAVIVKAKKLILDYTDAFKKEEGQSGSDVEAAFARAQALVHAVDPEADIPFKSSAALPGLEPDQEESVIFAFALLPRGPRLGRTTKSPQSRRTPRFRHNAPVSIFGGHGWFAYEQNTQQLPRLGLRRAPHALQS